MAHNEINRLCNRISKFYQGLPLILWLHKATLQRNPVVCGSSGKAALPLIKPHLFKFQDKGLILTKT